MSACGACGAALVRREGERADAFKKRRYCNVACMNAARRKDYSWEAEAEKMWGEGVTTPKIAETFGVTKNVVVGLATRRGWPPHALATHRAPPTTLFSRLDAIHAKFDAMTR